MGIKIVSGFVAFVHLYFLYIEMFKWESTRVRKIFGNSSEFAFASKVLAANQGLYNGFLSAGLIWGFFVSPEFSHQVFGFFLSCVFIAGIYGYATTKNIRIIAVQALPALVGLLLLKFG